MKVVLLIWYLNKNFGFREIESNVASNIDFEIWKCPNFASSASNCLTRYKQILSGSSLECKNALKFTRLSMKFYNHGRTSGHILTYATNTKSFGTTLFSFPVFQSALPWRVAGTHLRKEKSTPKVIWKLIFF